MIREIKETKAHTPRFDIYPNVVKEQYDLLTTCCNLVSYSSKTNPAITPILENTTDSMFSVHNQKELKYVKDKTRVIYFGLAWTTEIVQKLIEQGIVHFVVDNETDFVILKNAATKPLNIHLRLKLKERSVRSERYFVFGMASALAQKILAENKDSNHTFGIHVHRKTQNVNEWNLIDDISDALGDAINAIAFINIGGGLPAEYTNTKLAVIESVLQKVKNFTAWANNKNIKTIAEPGRFICAPAVKLITTIVRKYENTLVLNASVYNAYTDSVFGSQRLLVQGEGKEGTPYLLKGITPDSIDIFRYKVYLDNPTEGDEIVFLNAGAYNFSTDFCELEKVEVHINE